MINTISYLGLGTMGSGMVSNLLKAGCKLTLSGIAALKNADRSLKKALASPILRRTPSATPSL